MDGSGPCLGANQALGDTLFSGNQSPPMKTVLATTPVINLAPETKANERCHFRAAD